MAAWPSRGRSRGRRPARRVGEQDHAERVLRPERSTKLAAAAFAVSAHFFMLPLASSASTIDTGVTASWKVSIFCSTPSSTTTRSSAPTSRNRRSASVMVNSIEARTGGGLGANSRRGRAPYASGPRFDRDRAPRAVHVLVRRRVRQQVAVLHVGGEHLVDRFELLFAAGQERAAAGLRASRLRNRSPLSEMPATPPMPTT